MLTFELPANVLPELAATPRFPRGSQSCALFLVEPADKAVRGFLKFLNKVNRPRDVAEHLPGFRHFRQGFYANYAPSKCEKYEGFERGRPAAWLLKSEQAGHVGKCI